MYITLIFLFTVYSIYLKKEKKYIYIYIHFVLIIKIKNFWNRVSV